MRHQIRQSDDETFYYLLAIDDENNEKVLAENPDLKELQKHEDIAGKKVEVVKEADTRGTVEPPKQDDGEQPKKRRTKK